MQTEKSGQVLAEQQAHTSAELLSTGAGINVLYIKENKRILRSDVYRL